MAAIQQANAQLASVCFEPCEIVEKGEHVGIEDIGVNPPDVREQGLHREQHEDEEREAKVG